jgi:hypothetical protein
MTAQSLCGAMLAIGTFPFLGGCTDQQRFEVKRTLSGANAMRHAAYAHRLAAAAEIASSVRAMPIPYEVISGLPIRPSSLLASYAIGFT